MPVVLAGLLLAGCGDGPRASTPPNRAGQAGQAGQAAGDPAARATKLVATLSDEDLVGQVLMPYAYGNSASKVSAGSAAGNRKLAGVDTPEQMIAKYRLGGLILVGFSADDPTGGNQATTNVDNPAQVRDLTTGIQAAGGKLAAGAAPMLIGTDQEYGVVTRIKDGMTLLPSGMALGAAGAPALTEHAWRAAGSELAAIGINVDFAPDADVLRARSTVIGSRSYGADPTKVADQVGGAVRGLQGAGVAATLKHFPGHGDTAADSHQDLPVLNQDKTTLDQVDLPPFAAGVDAGAWLVMSGHLDTRAVDPGIPATFSHKVINDVLRKHLGFTGVVVTDGMNMAPAKRWPAGQAAVKALNAGNDLLLMPPNVGQAYNGLLAGLHDGSLPRPRLVEAATRVLTLKFRLAGRAAPPMSTLRSAPNKEAVARVSAAAVTQLRGSCAAVPGPVTVTSSAGRDRNRELLAGALRAAGVKVVNSGGRIVHLIGYGDTAPDLRPDAAVTVAMDTPYLLAQARSGVLLATYSSTAESMSALADVLAGRAKPTGRAPVPVPGLPPTSCS